MRKTNHHKRTDGDTLTVGNKWLDLVELISRQLENADQVREISWRSVGEDDDLQTADEQRAMEDVLLQNTLRKYTYNMRTP